MADQPLLFPKEPAETTEAANARLRAEFKAQSSANAQIVELGTSTIPSVAPTEENVWGKPDSCRACTLFSEPGIVRGFGAAHALILYLGEAPGAEEVDTPGYYVPAKHGPPGPGVAGGWRATRMKPFVGGSGRIRNAMCAHAGLAPQAEMFTTNVVKCRPPANRLPSDYEIACCAPFLLKELEEVNPNVVIAAGEIALNTVTGKKKIGLWRGVPTEGPRRVVPAEDAGGDGGPFSDTASGGLAARFKVFPTWHPAFIARSQYNWPFAVHDLARAKAESAFSEIRRIPINVVRDAKYAGHGTTLLARARSRGAATFDFETTGLSAQRDSILMCGFVVQADQGEVYDWTSGTQQLFQEILDDPDIIIIGQNVLNFDLPFAEEKGHAIPWLKVFDTMVAFHLANSSYGQTSVAGQRPGSTKRAMGAEKDLSFIASNHTDIEYWKSRDNYGSDLKGVCGLDCIATDRSATHPETGLIAELERYDMTDLYWKHVLPVHPVLKKMTRRGVRIHEDRAVRWAIVLEQEADRQEVALKEGLGDPFLNLNSPKQLMALLYDKLGLPVQYVDDKKKGRRPTVNAEAIETLAELAPENKILMSIVDIRHMRKMKSTYIEPALRGDGKLHPKFGVSKASTGRTNSWDPNAQNVPAAMRDIWIADSEDHVLVSSDWSQIEWRLAMILSGDPVGLELLTSGQDIHVATAAETLGLRAEDVTGEIRDRSKFIVYGLGYGRGATSIATVNNWPMTFVENFIQRFFARFKVFAAWRQRNVDLVKKQHYLGNAFKRRRWWYTYEVTEVYNFPQQSTAADMMYDILIAQDAELPKGATLRLTVHDEVVVNTPKDIARQTVQCLQDTMERLWPDICAASADEAMVRRFYPNGWHCPAEIHIGRNWKECKSKDPADKAIRAKLEKELGLA